MRATILRLRGAGQLVLASARRVVPSNVVAQSWRVGVRSATFVGSAWGGLQTFRGTKRRVGKTHKGRRAKFLVNFVTNFFQVHFNSLR